MLGFPVINGEKRKGLSYKKSNIVSRLGFSSWGHVELLEKVNVEHGNCPNVCNAEKKLPCILPAFAISASNFKLRVLGKKRKEDIEIAPVAETLILRLISDKKPRSGREKGRRKKRDE